MNSVKGQEWYQENDVAEAYEAKRDRKSVV